jgi:hypothetical protein
MAVAFFFLIFLSVLGLLMVLYCFHFRYRALSMGPERLRSALSRTVSGGEDAGEEDLLEGLDELERRLRRGLVLASLALVVFLALCLALVAWSNLAAVAVGLSGACVFMFAVLASLVTLRDIPRFLRRYLEGAVEEK